MSYPPQPGNPYGQQPPSTPPQQPYGYPPQQPAGQPAPPPQPGYGYPQQQSVPPQGGGYGQPGYAQPQQGGYPQQGYPQQGQPQYGGAPAGMPQYASWGARFGAMLLDGLIVGLVPGIVLMIGYVWMISSMVSSVSDCSDPTYSDCSTAAPSTPAGAILLILIGGLLSFIGGLFLVAKEGKNGQTPGKKALGIAVLRESDGQPLGFGMAFVRRLCHGLEFGIGWLWPLWDEKRQTFADKIVSTVVVKR